MYQFSKRHRVILCKNLDPELVEAAANVTRIEKRARDKRNVLRGAQLAHHR